MSKTNKLVINADTRERSGTSSVRRMRHEGLVPGIVYGGEDANVNIKFDHNKILHSLDHEAFHSSILEMVIDGNSEKVVLRDYQLHPTSDVKIMHVDFQRVSSKEKLSMTVPFHFTGEDDCDGINLEGGAMISIINELDIVCLPADLPEYITVDISKLAMGETMTLADLTLPKGVESQILVSGGEDTQGIVQIAAPRAEEEEPEVVVEGEEGAEEGVEGAEGADAASEEKSDDE
ncbi:MAG: 50S ribosomal protein L25/general stress protein Ctc [Arenicellales bacterium]